MTQTSPGMGSEREIFRTEQFTKLLPTIVAVDLGDLSGFVVATEKRDAIWPFRLESE